MLRSDRIVIGVDLDYFYAQCEEVRRPELRGKPVVICVYSGRTEESGAVSTANYVARKLGVRSGIPIVLAKRILGSYPEAVFLPMDKEYYETVSQRVMDALRTHESKFEQVSIDEAFLDTTKESGGNYKDAEEIAKKIKREIFELEKLTCSVGVSQNKLLAKMATDSSKPDGLTILLPEQVEGFLSPLPVDKLLGIGPKTEKSLRSMGISTIGELAKFDPEALAEKFGKNLGPHFAKLSQGLDDEPVMEREPEQLSRIITLKQDATTFDFAASLKPLAADLSQRLRAEKISGKVIGVIGITSILKTKNRAKTLDSPTDSEEVIFSVASELFRSYFSESREEKDSRLRRVGIRISGLEKDDLRKKEQQTRSNASLVDYFEG